MRRTFALAAAFMATLALTVACGNMATTSTPTELATTGPRAVTGAITFNGDPAIPSGAVLTVELRDVSLLDAPSVLIASQTIENPARFPIEFSVPYNPDEIDSRSRYGLHIEISLNDRLIYINDTAFDVITGGNPNSDVKTWVIAVGGE